MLRSRDIARGLSWGPPPARHAHGGFLLRSSCPPLLRAFRSRFLSAFTMAREQLLREEVEKLAVAGARAALDIRLPERVDWCHPPPASLGFGCVERAHLADDRIRPPTCHQRATGMATTGLPGVGFGLVLRAPSGAATETY